jgi:hypothetical protein
MRSRSNMIDEPALLVVPRVFLYVAIGSLVNKS